MLASWVVSLDESLAQLTRDVALVRDAAPHAPASARAEAACVALRTADALVAAAIELLNAGGVEEATGLSPEMLLQLDAGRMGAEARMITNAAAQLRAMPNLSSAFRDGIVTWSQVRAIILSTKTVRAEGRATIDELIGRHAPNLAGAEPDRLVGIVDEAVAQQRADLTAAREHRAVERGFLAIQPRLDGSGGLIYGEGDAEAIATIAHTLDAVADAPVDPDQDGPSRAQQRFDALLTVCEDWLSGTSGGQTRPRPRILASLDLKDLTDASSGEAMKLLWPLAGRPGRLSSVARAMLLCDATIVPVIFDRGLPVAVGDAAANISPKVRTALIARDMGCRFPGCNAPASWCDAHHIVPGYGNQVNDLMLLCRRCHRRMHRHRWRIRLQDDATITFTRRGRTYTSLPRHRGPPTALE